MGFAEQDLASAPCAAVQLFFPLGVKSSPGTTLTSKGRSAEGEGNNQKQLFKTLAGLGLESNPKVYPELKYIN